MNMKNVVQQERSLGLKDSGLRYVGFEACAWK